MRRFLTLAIASITAIAMTGCIIVPRHGGYYNDRYDRGGYHDHDRGDRGDRGR